MSNTAKEHLKSAGITFVVAAGFEVMPLLEQSSDWSAVAWSAISFVAVRAGVKALVEFAARKSLS
jgi:hypothetical protein